MVNVETYVYIPGERLQQVKMNIHDNENGEGIGMEFYGPDTNTVAMVHLSNEDFISLIKKAVEIANKKLQGLQ